MAERASSVHQAALPVPRQRAVQLESLDRAALARPVPLVRARQLPLVPLPLRWWRPPR